MQGQTPGVSLDSRVAARPLIVSSREGLRVCRVLNIAEEVSKQAVGRTTRRLAVLGHGHLLVVVMAGGSAMVRVGAVGSSRCGESIQGAKFGEFESM